MGVTFEAFIENGDDQYCEYTVKKDRGGVAIIGSLPITDLQFLIKAYEEQGYKVMSPRIATRIGASFVMCESEEKEAEWAKRIFHQGPIKSIVDYLNSDDWGVSSMTILRSVARMANEKIPYCPCRSTGVPHDAGDFGRCYRLLNEHLPQFKCYLGAVADEHPEWKPLVAYWDELETLFKSGNNDELAQRLRNLSDKGRWDDLG